jgi:hypothetical protein
MKEYDKFSDRYHRIRIAGPALLKLLKLLKFRPKIERSRPHSYLLVKL